MSTIETSTGRRASAVRVTHEPLTYEPASPHSYVRDSVLAKCNGDKQAEARLGRHASEMRVELPKLQRRLPSTVEYRVSPSTKDGQGGEFSPPLWVMERFATAPRPRRVLAAVLPSFPLPDGVSEVKLPRITTGTELGTPPDNAAVPIRDVITAAAESQVTTVEGASDWSMQTFEQSPTGAHLDWAIMKDLNEGADAKLEEKLFTGTGGGREITGILKLPTGAGAVSERRVHVRHAEGLRTRDGSREGRRAARGREERTARAVADADRPLDLAGNVDRRTETASVASARRAARRGGLHARRPHERPCGLSAGLACVPGGCDPGEPRRRPESGRDRGAPPLGPDVVRESAQADDRRRVPLGVAGCPSQAVPLRGRLVAPADGCRDPRRHWARSPERILKRRNQ